MSSPPSSGVRSQTLGRGLEALHILGDGRPRTSHELAEALGVPRSNAYRILRTCEEFAFVARTSDGRYTLGLGLGALADAGLRSADLHAEEVLAELANETAATAIFCIPQRENAVVLASVRPAARPASVAIRRSTRLPLREGAPGMAILSLRGHEEYEPDEVGLARSTGYVHTKGSPFPGFESVAMPVTLRDGQIGSVAIIYPQSALTAAVSLQALRTAATRLSSPLDVWID